MTIPPKRAEPVRRRQDGTYDTDEPGQAKVRISPKRQKTPPRPQRIWNSPAYRERTDDRPWGRFRLTTPSANAAPTPTTESPALKPTFTHRVHPHILAAVIESTGLTEEKCREAINALFWTIGIKLRERHLVHLPDFGGFGALVATPQRGRIVNWTPNPTIITRLNDPEEDAPALESAAKRARTDSPHLLLVHPFAPEDAALLTTWLDSRVGLTTEVNEAVLFHDTNTGFDVPLRRWSASTRDLAFNIMRMFAQRMPVPLLDIGLSGQGQRHEVMLYARDFEARVARRYPLPEASTPSTPNPAPLSWRTMSWRHFTWFGRDFYAWLERAGQRPGQGLCASKRALCPGCSNPFYKIRQYPLLYRLKGRPVVVKEWVEAMLTYPNMRPKERAVIWLLAAGLRAGEVCRLQLTDLSPTLDTLRVIGKGGKIRSVYPEARTQAVLMDWLRARAHLNAPWVFPQQRHPTQPIRPHHVEYYVTRNKRRVFPRPTDVETRLLIHPHMFRHYYVTDARLRSIPDIAIADQVGHANVKQLDTYTNPGTDWIREVVQKAPARPLPNP